MSEILHFFSREVEVPTGQKPLKYSMAEIIGWENIQRIVNTPVELIGTGVIGRRLAESLAYKGYPLMLVDPDVIESHNLLVQRFPAQYLDKFKVEAIGEEISQNLPIDNQIASVPWAFQQTVIENLPLNPAIVCCQTHDWSSRMEVAYHFYPHTPVVFSGIAATANMGWVFVQEPGKACLRCAFPDVEISSTAPCGGMSGDIAEIISGIVSYAVDTLAIDHPDRKRGWNLFKIDLTGFADAMHQREEIKRNANCELCQDFGNSQ